MVFLGRELFLQLFGIKIFERGLDILWAEFIALALLEGEGYDETIAFRRELGDRGEDAKIGIAFAQIKPAQQFLIGCSWSGS